MFSLTSAERLPRHLKHRLTVHFKCPTVKSGSLSPMLLRIIIVQTNLVAAMRVCSWRSARNARVSGLRRCDERTHVTMCVNELLFQGLPSSPVVLLVSHRLNCFADIFSVFLHTISPSFTPPAVLSTIVPSLVEIRCRLT